MVQTSTVSASAIEYTCDKTNIPKVTSCSKSSRPVLLVDAQATVIEAALKGVAKWKSKIKAEEGSQQEQSVSV